MSTETYEQVCKTIEALAAESFTKHVATPRGPGEWRFGAPGTNMYCSRVILRPGAVIVYGDIGEWILRISDSEPLAWLRGSVRSKDYLLGKIKAGELTRFYAPDALAWLDETCADDEDERSRRAKVKGNLNEYRYDELVLHEWAMACHEADYDDPPYHEYPTEGALWLHAMLRAFVAALDNVAQPVGPQQ